MYTDNKSPLLEDGVGLKNQRDQTNHNYAWYHYFTKLKWSEDGSSLICAACIFIVTLVLAICKQNLAYYEHTYQWVFGFLAAGMFIVTITHSLTNKDFKIMEYLALFSISLGAEAVGSYKAMHNSGLSGSFWAIIFGMAIKE